MPGQAVKKEAPKRQRRSFFMSEEQYEFLRNGIEESKLTSIEINKKLDKLLSMPSKVDKIIEKKTVKGITVDEFLNSSKTKVRDGFLQSGSNNGIKNNNGKKIIEQKQPVARTW